MLTFVDIYLLIITFTGYYLGEMWLRQLQHWRSWWICSKYFQASEKLIFYFLISHISCFPNWGLTYGFQYANIYVALLMFSISEGLDLVVAAIERAGYNGRIKLAIDVAATDFCVGK